jgi:hypothetical protein
MYWLKMYWLKRRRGNEAVSSSDIFRRGIVARVGDQRAGIFLAAERKKSTDGGASFLE